jgi:gas vesicle protein
MADRFDRVDNRGGGGFVMGLLTGTALGAGLGMLFAPKAGAELRGQLFEQAGTLPSTATEGYREATEIAGETGKSLLGVAREAVKNGTDEAQRNVRDAARGVTGTPPMFPAGSGHSSGSGEPLGFGSRSESSSGVGSESTRGTGSGATRASGSASATGGSRQS